MNLQTIEQSNINMVGTHAVPEIDVNVHYDCDLARTYYEDFFVPASGHEYIQVFQDFRPLLPAMNVYTAIFEVGDNGYCIEMEDEMHWHGHDMMEQLPPEDVVKLIDHYLGADWYGVGKVLNALYGEHHTVSRGYCQGDAYHVLGHDANKPEHSEWIHNLLWDAPIRVSIEITDPLTGLYIERYNYDYDLPEYEYSPATILMELSKDPAIKPYVKQIQALLPSEPVSTF